MRGFGASIRVRGSLAPARGVLSVLIAARSPRSSSARNGGAVERRLEVHSLSEPDRSLEREAAGWSVGPAEDWSILKSPMTAYL